ncbi:inactive histone-lysine N-methyltransferase 2E-like [Toxorhynchites rutilus septentrionalis]|uniref:inactive histone-lysine N-methyltransferase 2E-like n=1 Tax=Toxorhynchites rutilus septentrionalis TaxID=329112 RepID=UPI002478EA60|nr:inactive histone-lysine N-methyltransferase 2E-like [Toxorhynchites rutilus septentrionalis]
MQDDIQNSCRACGEADNSRMVACDKCEAWWHFDCVGVGESICEKDFICQECVPGEKEPDARKNAPKPSNVAGSDVGSSASSTRNRTKLRLMKLQEQKAIMKRQLELEQAEQRRRHEAERLLKESEVERKQLEIDEQFLLEKYRALEEECDEECNDQKSRKSVQSSISKVNRWQAQHLGGIVNYTLTTQETVPVSESTTTAVVQVPTHSKAHQPVANATTVTSVFKPTILETAPIATTSASNSRSAGVVAVQSSHSRVPVSTSSSSIPVFPKNTMPRPTPAMNGAPN